MYWYVCLGVFVLFFSVCKFNYPRRVKIHNGYLFESLLILFIWPICHPCVCVYMWEREGSNFGVVWPFCERGRERESSCGCAVCFFLRFGCDACLCFPLCFRCFSCIRKKNERIVGDESCCMCNTAAMRRWTGLDEEDIVHCSFEDDVSRLLSGLYHQILLSVCGFVYVCMCVCIRAWMRVWNIFLFPGSFSAWSR